MFTVALFGLDFFCEITAILFHLFKALFGGWGKREKQEKIIEKESVRKIQRKFYCA